MILSDQDIARELASGRLVVTPRAEGALQPCSIDIRLGDTLRGYHPRGLAWIDPCDPDPAATFARAIGPDGVVLQPSQFVLGTTMERVVIPSDLVALLEGRSTLARCGLTVHQTAGLIDPGFRGELTLELQNVGHIPIRLTAGMPIGQLTFQRLTSPSVAPYGDPSRHSKYQGQAGPVAPRAATTRAED